MKAPLYCGILVTGASGFSGSHIVKYLQANGHMVFAHHGRKNGDLAGNSAFLSDLPHKASVLVHLAACSPWPNVRLSDIADNVNATRNLIRYARVADVSKIIYFSSISLYGEIKGGFLTEGSPRINPDFYGMTKSLSEELLADSGIPTVSLRLPGILGKGARRNWLSQVNQFAAAGVPVPLYNPDGPFNNAVHIEYLAELVHRLVYDEWPTHGFEPYLVASSGSMTALSVVEQVVRGRSDIIPKDFTAKEPFVISTKKLSTLLAPWSVEKTIERYAKDEGAE